MAEKSKGRSRRRSYAREFIGLGGFEGRLPTRFLVRQALLWLGISVALTAMLLEYRFQSIPDYEVGDIADRTIEAPEEFTVVDNEATERKKAEAIQKVPVVFAFDVKVNHRVVSDVRMSFADARQAIAEEREKLGLAEGQPLPASVRGRLKQKLEQLVPRFSGGMLDIGIKHEFSTEFEDQIVQILSQCLKFPGVVINRETLLRYQNRGIVLRNTITGETQALTDWLQIKDLGQALDLLRQLEYELISVKSEEKRELLAFLEKWVVPNVVFDEAATLEAEQKAEAEVDPVLIQVKKGKTIVRPGDEITAGTLSQLEALKQVRRKGQWIAHTIGVFLIVGFSVFVLMSYFRLKEAQKGQSRSDVLLLTLILAISVILARLFTGLGDLVANSVRVPELQNPLHFYLYAPLALGAVLVVLLVGVHLAIFFALLNAVLVALLTGEITLSIYALGGSLAAMYALEQYRERTAIVRAGLIIGAVNVFIAFALQLYSLGASFDWLSLAVRSVGALVSGLLTGMLTSLFLPGLESLFGLTTDVRLLELSNLNSPILRRLALEAPGSYHHSITVGTLAEAGAESIGANSLLVRVGAYYHDIGKLRHPEYYVENQLFSANKHEGLSPTMSSLILASHVKDGLAIAHEVKLGPQVSDLIPQHHGTRLMTYFYQKAKETADSKNVDVSESDFRYPGPKPQSKEAAILMLADQVEAAARTLQDPTPGQIRGLINRLTQATIQDGQFDECDITMMELAKVSRAFERVLTGMYHHRIEYPGYDFNKRMPAGRPDEDLEQTRSEHQRIQ